MGLIYFLVCHEEISSKEEDLLASNPEVKHTLTLKTVVKEHPRICLFNVQCGLVNMKANPRSNTNG